MASSAAGDFNAISSLVHRVLQTAQGGIKYNAGVNRS